ncbi:H-NS histone family protein [Methyloversatilis sp. XJ19-13]|nr:H-NS histone family protein [Methyloversatilis sp. XJ19-13]
MNVESVYHSISSLNGETSMSGQSYDELMAKISDLQQQAEVVRRAELESVIADVKAKIKKYNLSAADVGLSGSSAKRAARPANGAKVKIAPGKYRNPENGEIKEVGAAGRKPGWLASMTADQLNAARVN